MFVVVWVGLRMAGRVVDTGESHVETRCVHVMGLPLVPTKSYLVIDQASGASIELPTLHTASVVAAYGRAWGPVLAIAGAASALGGLHPMSVLYVALGLAGTILGWRAGRLSADERARCAVYAEHLGRAMDPLLMAESERLRLRDELHAAVVQAAVVYAGKGYRDAGASPRDAWESVVLAAEVTDVQLVARALTLARLEAALAGDERATRRFSAAHDALWAKLCALRTAPAARLGEAPTERE